MDDIYIYTKTPKKKEKAKKISHHAHARIYQVHINVKLASNLKQTTKLPTSKRRIKGKKKKKKDIKKRRLRWVFCLSKLLLE